MQQDRQPHKTIIAISEIGDYKGRTEKKTNPEKSNQDKGKINIVQDQSFSFDGVRTGTLFFCTNRENA